MNIKYKEKKILELKEKIFQAVENDKNALEVVEGTETRQVFKSVISFWNVYLKIRKVYFMVQ